MQRFSLNNRYLGRLPGQVASGFVSGFKRDEVEAFFEKYPEGGAGEEVKSLALYISFVPNWNTLYTS